MGLFCLKSTNPNFSHVISKNPNTIIASGQPFRRPLRKGQLYGWFTSEKADEWRMLFKDSDIDTSFGNQEFEYLDKTRYCSPQLPIAMIAEALRSASMSQTEADVLGYSAECNVTIDCGTRTIRTLTAQMSDKVQFEGLSDNVDHGPWQVKVTAETVNEVLNIVQIVCILACFDDKDIYVPMKEDGVRKYLRSLLQAKAPYFMWHVFASRAITNRSLFDKVKDDLDKSGFQLNYGNTQIQRFDKIRDRLADGGFGETLIDIGCGEMFQAFRLGQIYGNIFAIEADKELAEINQAKIQKRNIENIQCINEVASKAWVQENDLLFNQADVLMTEVLEHMDLSKALDLLAEVLKTDYRKIVITVPNRAFNVNYGLEDGEIRHPDHKWEPDFQDVTRFCADALALSRDQNREGVAIAQITGIGDMVRSIPASIMIEFTRAESIPVESTRVENATETKKEI